MPPPELLIVGSGPIGIACGIEAARRGVPAVIVEKGALLNSICRFAPQLVFFSTARLLELADVPFVTSGPKPTRAEILQYYRRLVEHFDLDVRLHEPIQGVEALPGSGFRVRSTRETHAARFVVLAIGFYDLPNLLGIEGEDLPKVSHYYADPHPFFRRRVAVIGGQNSAVEAALELQRTGAVVTLIHRGPALGDGVKYWIRPDIENRIKEGSIGAFFNTTVVRITERSLVLRAPDGTVRELENDFVFALTGYHADRAFLERAGIHIDPETLKPRHDPRTMETNVPGLYVAGVAAGGREANKIFIENSRVHALMILDDVMQKRARVILTPAASGTPPPAP
jgi:thioredoxin reductase (NADPH)